MNGFTDIEIAAKVTIDDYNNERDLIVENYRALKALRLFHPLFALIELDERGRGFRETEMFSEVYPLPREGRFPTLMSHKRYRLDLEKAIGFAGNARTEHKKL